MQNLTKLILFLGLLVCLLFPATGWGSDSYYPHRHVYTNGAYDGQYHGVYGYRHGVGTYIWNSHHSKSGGAKKYVGRWDMDKPTDGTIFYSDGNKSRVSEGMFCGQDGNQYAVLKHTQGPTIFLTGGKCPKLGERKHSYSDGEYVGQFREDFRHGVGTYYWNDGKKYVGRWDMDSPSDGTMFYPDGTKVKVYEAVFCDPDGDPVLQEFPYTIMEQGVDGLKIFRGGAATSCPKFGAGEAWIAQKKPPSTPRRKGRVEPSKGYPSYWICSDRLRYCFGDATYYNGDRYQGEWRYGKRHGIGTYRSEDGTVLEGVWKDGAYQSKFSQKKSPPISSGKTICPGTYNPSTWTGCFGTRVLATGDKYVGEHKDGKPHGQGTGTYANGNKYVGGWKDGKPHGQGTGTFANGNKYVGEHKDGKQHGQGTYTWASGNKYVGGWKDGKPHGQGTDTFANGNKYVGEYKDGKHHGQGTATFANGDKYVGEFKDGKQRGQGTYTFANGNKYVGEVKHGGHHGQGTYTYTNGDKYVGEFKYGKRHGQGTFTFANGNKYVGEFKLGKRHGQGTGTFANGNKYVGEFKYEKAHGQGAFTFANGDKYVGGWKDGKRHGQGTFTFANGDKYVGEVKDGKRHGQGTATFATGDKYVGGWKDGKRHGQGTYTYTNGDKYVGEVKDGKRHGQGILTNADGKVLKKGFWKDGTYVSKYVQKDSPSEPKRTPARSSYPKKEIQPVRSGSGFPVTADGHFITNAHVIEGCGKVEIHLPHEGISFPVRIITSDKDNDLALLKGDFKPKSHFSLSVDPPKLRQPVTVAGFPLAQVLGTSTKMNDGRISSLRGVGGNISNIMIDAAVQAGNSGGPIVGEKGNVIAVTVSQLDQEVIKEKYNVVTENTNFGVKSSVVRNLLDGYGLPLSKPSTRKLEEGQLTELIHERTYYLACWMTKDQYRKAKKLKQILFRNVEFNRFEGAERIGTR